MDKFSIIGIITLMILFVAVLFTFFLLTVKTKNKTSNNLLAGYFIVFALHISVFAYAPYIELPQVVEMLRDQIISFSSPLLFLYLISNIYSDFKFRPVHLLHFLPFIIRFLLFVPGFYSASEEERIVFSENFNDQIEVKISVIIGVLISMLYLVLMFVELKKYKEILTENYSSTSSFNYKWLYQLTVFVLVLFIFSQIKQWYKFVGDDLDVLNIMRLVLILMLLGFLSWIVLKSMYQPELFKAIDSKHQLVKTLVKEEVQNSADIGKDDDVQLQIKQLQEFMEKEEPYLDSSLNIQKLAYQFKMPSRDFSILINHHLNQHFFDFITAYRIKKAIDLLEDPANKKMTILEILYHVGFNSKSPFNKAFKKHTGLTPTAYRAKL